MITHIPFSSLGHANHGWLDARHHFSFANYHNPARMGFGNVLVINDDTIAAGRGFGRHPHDNMEIITYVRSGAITHQDSMGNEGRTAAGDVQVMSAGTGVQHSEYNREVEPTTLYQIWIVPNARDVAPRWDAKAFPKSPVESALTLLVSGLHEHKNAGAMHIHADAAIYGGKLNAGTTFTHPLTRNGYVLASAGQFRVNDVALTAGDGAEITREAAITLTALTDCEVLVIDVG